jgi:hypothetical protein
MSDGSSRLPVLADLADEDAPLLDRVRLRFLRQARRAEAQGGAERPGDHEAAGKAAQPALTMVLEHFTLRLS